MAEYIEREAALNWMYELIEARRAWTSDARGEIQGLNAAICAIEDIPAADVVPVRHGRWVWDEESWWHKCSACGMTFGYDGTYELFDHGFQLANYCPNCGARMDGDGAEPPKEGET